MATPGTRTAVVVHAYHTYLLPELEEYLGALTLPLDVVFTTPHTDLNASLDGWRRRGIPVDVSVHENRGKDMVPFVSLLRSGALDPYDVILKLHLKRSGYSDAGTRWRRSLYDLLCGDDTTARRSLDLLHRDGVGMVGPHPYFLTHPDFWGSNRARVEELVRGMGIRVPDTGPPLGFFAGSMFWCRRDALAPLRSLPDHLLRCEDEAGQRDGTLAHALERVMGLAARHAGFTVTSLPLQGGDIFDEDCSANRVPVL